MILGAIQLDYVIFDHFCSIEYILSYLEKILIFLRLDRALITLLNHIVSMGFALILSENMGKI